MFIISLFFIWNVAFWQWGGVGWWTCSWESVPSWMYCCDWIITNVDCNEIVITPGVTCPEDKIYRISGTQTGCCPGEVENWQCKTALSDIWINISTDCLLDWQCSLNVYETMWIRKSNENPTVLWFFQDITIASTTAILWTVLVIAMIIGWLSWSIASITGKDTKKWKTIMISCFVWLLLIMGSYAIIRLIQFLATAWS